MEYQEVYYTLQRGWPLNVIVLAIATTMGTALLISYKSSHYSQKETTPPLFNKSQSRTLRESALKNILHIK